MASVRVPKKYHTGLAKFLSLPDGSFTELISNLRNGPMMLDFRAALKESISRVESIPTNDAERIVDSLVSLYLAKASSDDPTSVFVDEVVQAIETSNSEELQVAAEHRAKIRERLASLLEVELLAMAAKATSVLYEYENIFYRARVLTDMRPIFSSDLKSTEAAVIIHNLRIHYHKGEMHRDFFIALDTQDIQKLIDTLERAKAKAESLKTALSKAGIPYIEPEEE